MKMNHEFFLDPFHIQYAVFYKLVFIAFSKLISVSLPIVWAMAVRYIKCKTKYNYSVSGNK